MRNTTSMIRALNGTSICFRLKAMLSSAICLALCACASQQTPQKTARLTRHEALQQYDFSARPGQRSTAAVPIDAEVLTKLIRQRLTEVQRRALMDLFKGPLASTETTKPLKDVIDALAALALELTEAEAHSQNLAYALTSASLSFSLAALAHAGKIDAKGCTGIPNLTDAAYEGLAQSDYLSFLGFPHANGEVAEGCQTFSKGVGATAAVLGRVSIRDVGLVLDGAALTGLVTAYQNACAAPAPAAPIVRAEVARFRSLAPTPANIADLLEVSAPRQIGELNGMIAKADAATTPGLVACRTALEQLDAAFPAGIRGLVLDAGGSITFDALSALLATASATLKEGTASSAPAPLACDGVGRAVDAALLKEVADLVRALSQGQPLTRSDIIDVYRIVRCPIKQRLEASKSEDAKAVALAVIDAIPVALQEKPTKDGGPPRLRLDVPLLASRAVSAFDELHARGPYFVANVGVGYLWHDAPDGGRNFAPTVHEELGVGYRFNSDPVRVGVHAMASGLLYQLEINDETHDVLLVGGGPSANLYRLLEVSANLAVMVDLRGEDKARPALLLGLEVPILDYLSALGSSGPTIESADHPEK